VFLTTRWGAVLLGAVAGSLVAAVVALIVWGILSGVEPAISVMVGTTAGVVAALFGSGWVAGRAASFHPGFHGALAAMLFSTVVVVFAVRGGSAASPGTVLLLAIISIGLGFGGGVLGGRRRAAVERARRPEV
jgi:hypothetical protein